MALFVPRSLSASAESDPWIYVDRRSRRKARVSSACSQVPDAVEAAAKAARSGRAFSAPKEFAPSSVTSSIEEEPCEHAAATHLRRGAGRSARRQGRGDAALSCEAVEQKIHASILACAEEVERSEFWQSCEATLLAAMDELRGASVHPCDAHMPHPLASPLSPTLEAEHSSSSAPSAALAVSSSAVSEGFSPCRAAACCDAHAPSDRLRVSGGSETSGSHAVPVNLPAGSAPCDSQESARRARGRGAEGSLPRSAGGALQTSGAVLEPCLRLRSCALVCLGLGSPTECSDTASCRYQLGLALLLQRRFGISPSRCFVADPAMCEVDFAILQRLGFSPQASTDGSTLPAALRPASASSSPLACPCAAPLRVSAPAASAAASSAAANATSSPCEAAATPAAAHAAPATSSSSVSPTVASSLSLHVREGDFASWTADDAFVIYLLPHCDADLYGKLLSDVFRLSPFCARCREPGCASCGRCLLRCDGRGAPRPEERDACGGGREGPGEAGARGGRRSGETCERRVDAAPSAESARFKDGVGARQASRDAHVAACGARRLRDEEARLRRANCIFRTSAQSFLLIGNAFSSYDMRRARFAPFDFSAHVPASSPSSPSSPLSPSAALSASFSPSSASSASLALAEAASPRSGLLAPSRAAHLLFYFSEFLRERPLSGDFAPHPRAFNDLAVAHADLGRFPASCAGFWAHVQQRQRAEAATQGKNRVKRRGERALQA
ncbi:SRR1 protein [Besnoitia besnoiti]|uniref:SRR1 protein n=1 Tax=Besnoitia besnoiti TaxID=94643 RepID=A0A2A9MQ92_BESBE|nr:SRR1 protein [Besnoitia besnoiti]PFH38132.1 SRR1 protein [Besnoitia besnoiti]